jgi:hypothetical protein
MKREDFTIDGIPEGYIVYDVDLTPSGLPVAVVCGRSDGAIRGFVLTNDVSIPLADSCIRFIAAAGRPLLQAHVRAVGDERVVVVAPAGDGREWVLTMYDARGEILADGRIGEDVEEVLGSDSCVLVFYRDEGQMARHLISCEGLAVFSANGEYLWGHRSQFPEGGRLDIWFDAAVWTGPDEVAVFADVDSAPRRSFIRLNIDSRSQTILRPPDSIACPRTVTLADGRAILHGLHRDGRPIDDIVLWEIGAPKWEVIGTYPHKPTTKYPPLRGLPGGRFIAPKPDGYTILSFD